MARKKRSLKREAIDLLEMNELSFQQHIDKILQNTREAAKVSGSLKKHSVPYAVIFHKMKTSFKLSWIFLFTIFGTRFELGKVRQYSHHVPVLLPPIPPTGATNRCSAWPVSGVALRFGHRAKESVELLGCEVKELSNLEMHPEKLGINGWRWLVDIVFGGWMWGLDVLKRRTLLFLLDMLLVVCWVFWWVLIVVFQPPLANLLHLHPSLLSSPSLETGNSIYRGILRKANLRQTPENYVRYQQWPYWKGVTFFKPSFWVLMLVFRGVRCTYEIDLYGIILSYLHTVDSWNKPCWYGIPALDQLNQMFINDLYLFSRSQWLTFELGEITYVAGNFKFKPFMVRNDWMGITRRWIDFRPF